MRFIQEHKNSALVPRAQSSESAEWQKTRAPNSQYYEFEQFLKNCKLGRGAPQNDQLGKCPQNYHLCEGDPKMTS